MQIYLGDLSHPRTRIQSRPYDRFFDHHMTYDVKMNLCRCLVLYLELPFERVSDPSLSLSDRRAKIRQIKTINYQEQDGRSPVGVYDPHSSSSPRELESQHQSP